MSSTTHRTVNISVANIEAAVLEKWLRPMHLVDDNEEIGEMVWGEIVKDPMTGADVIPITFPVKKEVTVEVG